MHAKTNFTREYHVCSPAKLGSTHGPEASRRIYEFERTDFYVVYTSTFILKRSYVD